MLYAIGDAMNSEDNVPITTPRIIANAKLRIESPPRMKIHSNTINVLNEVLMVRASVVFRESLNNTRLVTFRIQTEELTYTVEDYHLIIDRVTDSRQDSTDKCLVDFQRERQDTPEQ